MDIIFKPRQLPEDKAKLLAIMDRYLSLPEDERINYTMGKRLGYYQELDDMNNADRKAMVAEKVEEIRKLYPGHLDEVFHYLREQVV